MVEAKWNRGAVVGKTCCPLGHGMWNGDGKPVVYAFRVNFLKQFTKEHPNCKLVRDSWYCQLYDCTDGVPGEDLDIWYCDECKSLTVFVDNERFDYLFQRELPMVSINELPVWEEYIALRDKPFEDFMDFYEGKSPLEAIETYNFQFIYKLSPAKDTIYAFDKAGKISFGFTLSRHIIFPVN